MNVNTLAVTFINKKYLLNLSTLIRQMLISIIVVVSTTLFLSANSVIEHSLCMGQYLMGLVIHMGPFCQSLLWSILFGSSRLVMMLAVFIPLSSTTD